MKRILIIGSPGSGKSTLSQYLKDKLNLPLYHMDMLYWYGNWEYVSRDELIGKIENILEKEKFIIDGNYSSTLKMRIKKADTIILLNYPTYLCLYRVLKRMIKKENRSDMPETCKEKLDLKFLIYVLNFKRKNKEHIFNLINNYFKGDLFLIKNKKEYKNFIERMENGKEY